MRNRSPTLITAACLLWLGIGAAITVGVAWCGGVMMPLQRQAHFDAVLASRTGGFKVSPLDIDHSPKLAWPLPRMSEIANAPDKVDAYSGTAWNCISADGRQSSGGENGQPEQVLAYQHQTLSEFGAPVRSMQIWFWAGGLPPNVSERGSPKIKTPWSTNRREPFVLPVVPLWLGFFADTFIYAACAWGVWQVPLILREHSRRRRGLCPRCGYSLAGLPENAACPECGRGHIANHT